MPSTKGILLLPKPWRCDCCKQVMYVRDAKGYPTAGAPLPHYATRELSEVCSLCHFLLCEVQDLLKFGERPASPRN